MPFFLSKVNTFQRKKNNFRDILLFDEGVYFIPKQKKNILTKIETDQTSFRVPIYVTLFLFIKLVFKPIYQA